MTRDEYKDEGDAAMAVGELAEAIPHYRAAVELDPEFFDAWQALCMVNYKLGHFADAVEAGLRATQINPNEQTIWTSLSLAYVGNGQKAEAEAASGKAKIISWGGKIRVDAPAAPAPEPTEQKSA